MAVIESLIAGSEKLTEIFGNWPSFHDAEVLDLRLDRGDIQTDKSVYEFPALTLKIHVWELTNKTNSEGYLILLHHTLATLKFCDVADFQMQGFNHQNALMELVLKSEERTEGPSPYFAVKLEPAFGIEASFKCLRIEVIDVVPCSDTGELILSADSQ